MKKIIAAFLAISSLGAFAQSPADVVDRDFYWTGMRGHIVNERFVPAGAALFFGDSIVQALDFPEAVAVANFGISGDTSYGVAARMPRYESLKTAGAVFIGSGVNDLGFGSQFDKSIAKNYRAMMAATPKDTFVYVLGVLPVQEDKFPGYNARIKAVNKQIAKACSMRSRCRYLKLWSVFVGPDGQAKPGLYKEDGIHPNEAGSKLILDAALKRLTP